MNSELANEFHREMLAATRRCKDELGYNPTYWLRMVQEHGGVEAAKRLLRSDRASDGFTRLWEEGRLDLTVEAFVLLPKYEPLFDQDERREARRRLQLYEFDVDGWLAQVPAVSTRTEGQGQSQEPDAATTASTPEAPVIAPVAAPGGDVVVWPTADDLERARAAFGTHEPRDIFYRAATYLVERALTGDAPVSLAEAIAVLLQTWNRPFYQYRSFDADHYAAIEGLLQTHSDWLAAVRDREISSYDSRDKEHVERTFREFELVLGPVGAAKALHLLAPRFLPLWDRAIALAYGLELHRMGTNGSRYATFMEISKEQIDRLCATPENNPLKAVDEFNYCHFSKGWI